MDVVRVGIVGSRFAAGFHADCYSRNEKARVVAVAAIDNLEPFSSQWGIPDTYEDYNEMLARDDIALVSVCVPNFLHHDVAVAAARAGKHVVCEKPLSTNVKDAQDVVDVKAKEVHNGSHSPFAKKVSTCGGGSLIHLAIHPIGYAIYLLGGEDNPLAQVVGQTSGGLEANYVHKDFEGEDWFAGLMKFADGKRAFVEGNYITVGGMDDVVEIYGTEGVIKVYLTFGSNLDVYSRRGYSYAIEKADFTHGWTKPAVDEFYNLGYVREINYFVDCILKDEQPRFGVDGAAGLACLKAVEAFYRSAAEGRSVTGPF